nr:hypothetical protein [Paraburkholderia caffeinilytica]
MLAALAQVQKISTDTLIDSLATLSTINGTAVVQHGARLAVIGELLTYMLTHLPYSMRVAWRATESVAHPVERVRNVEGLAPRASISIAKTTK